MYFTYPSNGDYVRDTQIVEGYFEQTALYASRMTDVPYDECLEFIKKGCAPGGIKPFKDPQIAYLSRQKNGDRQRVGGTFMGYLQHVYDNKLVMAPTMTVYLNRNQRPSKIADFVLERMKARKVFKDKMFDAKMEGLTEMEDYFNGLQSGTKIDNNSVSGAHASAFNILFNKTSHSSLTSSCRISTSYANANGEWFLGGNRHFWCPQVTLTSLINACLYTDLDAFQAAMDKYNLHYPSAEETIECISRSTRNYWRGREAFSQLEDFVKKMTPIEKAAFVYTGDLFHLAKHNPTVVKDFLVELASPSKQPSANPDASFKRGDGDITNMATLLLADVMQGLKLDKAKKERPDIYAVVAGAIDHVVDTLEKWKVLIHGIFRPKMLPPSIAVLPNIIRRVVATSDTDSTIFTNQYWTRWVAGEEIFSKFAYQIGYVTTYLNSQLVRHKLAIMSANIGAIEEHIGLIQMKNEYFFPAYALTSVSKHYFAYRSAQEGNILPELEEEIKGVHLRDSSSPPEIVKGAKNYMMGIMTKIMHEGKLTYDDVVNPIAELEKDIIKDIQNGGVRYLKSAQIQNPRSYAQGEKAAPYKHYLLWNEVFAPKYGMAPQLPFRVIRVSVELPGRKDITEWLTQMDDRALADRMLAWLGREEKTSITEFQVPVDNLTIHGMPKELLSVIDTRKLITKMTTPFYMAAESVGIRMRNKKMTKLISDFH